MGIKTYNPYTPSRRHMTGSDFSEITKSEPEKVLLVSLKKNAGRNDGVHHNLLRLALDAIRFDRHFRPQSFFSGSDPIPTFLSNRDRQRSVHACLQRTAIIL